LKWFPADIEEKLGFDMVRARLIELAETEPGKARIADLRPSSEKESIEHRLELVGEWVLSIESAQNPGLGDVPDVRKILERIAPSGSWVGPEEALAVVDALKSARLVQSFFSSNGEVYPACASEARALQPDKELEASIAGLFDQNGQIRDDASPELRRIRKQMSSTEDRLRRAATKALAEAQGHKIAAGDEPTIRGGRTVIPVRAQAKRKLEGLVVDSSATGQTVFVEPQECVELNNELRLLEGKERRELVRILEAITDDIRAQRHALSSNQEILVRFDVVRAAARLSIQLRCRRPDLSEEGQLDIRAARNPALVLVRQRARGAEADLGIIPLTVTLPNESRVLVISGPNAGGKSVTMKTIGLLSLMASYGLRVPAEEGTTLPVFNSIFADIGDEQSIETDLSTFSSHLERLKEIIGASDVASLILIDEIGSSTDPAAGAAIAQAVIERLVESRATAVITTHFGDLKAFAHETEGVVNGAMMFDRQTLSPTYTFELGIPGSSFAFEIAERTEFPAKVLSRARALSSSGQAKLEDLLAALEQAQRHAAELETSLESRLEQAEAARVRAEEAERSLEERRDRVLASAEHEADKLLSEANRTIERTIREIREAEAERGRTRRAREDVAELQSKVSERVASRKKKKADKRETAEKGVPISQGDQVLLDDGTTVGEVIEIGDGTAVVAFGSMQARVRADRLTRVGGHREQQVKVGRTSTSASVDAGLAEVSQQLDLRGYRVAEAIPLVERFIDRAVRAGLNRVEILHGTGTGALRFGVHEHLESMLQVKSYREAPIEQGGAGITVVTLN
jgi:DNA mismatch repair protein MutS2